MALTHAQKHAPTPASAPRPARSATTASSFTRRPGRWVDGWDPEDAAQWHHAGGAQTARTNLACSVYAEFLGFGVFALWAIVVPQLKKYGYTGSAALSESQQFWLLSVPTLVGASLRVPYTFAVPRFGGRNWTIISSLLLLLPTIGLALAVGQHASFPVLLTVAALAGFGGGNFASSMTNISFFYRSSQKGKALGLNAAGGNLGTAAVQFTIPLLVTFGATAGTAGSIPNLPLAGWIFVPLVLVSAGLAWRFMDNLSVISGTGDRGGFEMASRARHTWVLAVLYIGTFGSFIGFAGAFPKIMSDAFPQHGLKLAFLGALVGSLTRPLGGVIADRVGGARITVISFVAMALGAGGAVIALQGKNFGLFMATFLLLFVFTGIGNGSIYRMIPAVFEATGNTCDDAARQRTRRIAAGSIGIVGAVGAFGGFLIPQGFALSKASTVGSAHPTGTIVPALVVIIGVYVLLGALTWAVYARRGAALAKAGI
ncbi:MULTISPECIES: MFS transporter [Dermacoccus]|uniref:Nitrate transporter n=1 Tax=Dermacoccus nishinomiyaensis TaxID=1274 RepID=A0A075JEL1_9MICO|nr:MFS transporter [Dermacoccus nishinomiyaensis]AIF40135.1 nitrate transporter [Dermacoccus nishinomiyaensis]MCG7428553.1 MFS transporter [Dermacoccus nishinomiyaensis]NHC31644.1 NarK/NasA family nitrate transporter [Dermacoccus nishinomiyaensis]